MEVSCHSSTFQKLLCSLRARCRSGILSAQLFPARTNPFEASVDLARIHGLTGEQKGRKAESELALVVDSFRGTFADEREFRIRVYMSMEIWTPDATAWRNQTRPSVILTLTLMPTLVTSCISRVTSSIVKPVSSLHKERHSHSFLTSGEILESHRNMEFPFSISDRYYLRTRKCHRLGVRRRCDTCRENSGYHRDSIADA